MEPQAAADSSPSAARSLTQKAASWVLRASSSLPAMVSRSNSGTLSSKVEPVPLVAISGKALEEYHDLFAMMDQDGSGDVSLDELKVMFKNMQIRVADSEIKSIVIAMDADKSGTVSFPEFASVLHALVLTRREVSNPSVYAIDLDPPLDQGGAGNWIGGATPRSVQWVIAQVGRVRAAVWELLDDPASSWASQLISWWLMAAIIVSVTTFVVETVPGVHRQHDQLFSNIESVCMIHFVIEFALRLLSCPNLVKFGTDVMNIIDFVAILPFFLELAMQGDTQGTAVIRAVRLVRVFRVVKVSRYLAWLRVFAATVHASVAPLGMILFVIGLLVILLSSAAYFAERGESPGFDSIPESMWWCVVTMTTIGFGRSVPRTLLGKLVGSIAATCGVVILAIPISVIATNFQLEFAKLTTSRAAVARSKALAGDDESNGALSSMLSSLRREPSSAAAAALEGCRARCCRPSAAPGEDEDAAVDGSSHRTSVQPLLTMVQNKANSAHLHVDPDTLRHHWSAPFLRTSIDTITANRRRLMSSFKQVELRNRDSIFEETARLVDRIGTRDRLANTMQ
ncbi:hypothetical protein FNF29_02517 [Cafeteria roenbergensis]|uniref:EF-hand domain-containing protein n=1 Tax=Cafeteria roenbergensis TaxID=33653 RepID=A0A5A8CP70_CAFRO|nr:hypothetical protein FNF29_02517 [Cafeteria roenbergensis]|eukprot:KAA0154297.1 hypothetical protein FNF29_02517 [Cafeteria roenbergensis]